MALYYFQYLLHKYLISVSQSFIFLYYLVLFSKIHRDRKSSHQWAYLHPHMQPNVIRHFNFP